MSVTNKNKLLFFNKEGYPYNFELDTDHVYKGKLIFDENSSDTFKTLGIYMFEEVSPFTITDNFLLNKMEIYNNSGISFIPLTNSGDTISNIERVNSSTSFYSKWVFGTDLDDKYPKGTIVSFSGLSFTTLLGVPATLTDFDNKYYTVLDNKPDAILINTETVNSSWEYLFVTGGTSIIDSHNIIAVNDYDSTLYTDISSWTLHDNKKFSVVGTVLNDGVKVYNDQELMKTIYQTYNTNELSGSTGDILRFDFELKTERPKLYQGSATFDLSGSTAYITFAKKLNSLINIDEGQDMIFEDYDDNPILPNNPTFTIIDGTTDVEVFDGTVQFIQELNVNKTFMRHFNDKSLSSQNFVKNTTPTQFIANQSSFVSNYPKTFFEYDNYIQITGVTGNFTYTLEKGDTIQLSSSTQSSGSTRQKNISRKFNILEIQKFRDIRINYWKGRIVSSPPWYDLILQKATDAIRTVEEQMELDAVWMYNTRDNDQFGVNYIPLNQRYEKIRVKEYVNEENTINSYNIQKLLKTDQVRKIQCSMSIPTPYLQTFTMDVVAYDTSNILSFTQELLAYSSEDETNYRTTKIDYWKDYIINNSYAATVASASADTFVYLNDISGTIETQLNADATVLYNINDSMSGVSYTNTINAFNINYGDYLYNNYGILVYYSSATTQINIHSIYSLNYNTNITYDRYFIQNVYLNDINLTGISNVTGISNSEVDRVLIEFDDQLVKESVLPNDSIHFDNIFSSEIYFDLSNNENDFGFNLELNDFDYYIGFTGDTLTTINSFITKYTDQFGRIGLNLYSGTTTLSETGTSGYTSYDATGTTWITGGTIEIVSGYTLLIDADYPNIDVRTIKPKVNIFSSYEIISKIDNKTILLSGNELELSPTLSGTSLFEYGFATGMILTVSGSQYITNNVSYNVIGLTETIIELSYQGLFFDDVSELTLDVDRFLRKPRESANKDIYYSWRFAEPYSENIFFYDLSGDHLKPYDGISSLTYIGQKPLWDTTDVCSESNKNISLIDEANKNLLYVSDPNKQQTVFRGKNGEYCLEFLLDEYDSVSEFDYIPEPLQVFLGYNSSDEGVSNTKIILDKVENIIFTGYTNSTLNNNGIDFNFDVNGLLEITTNQVNFNFNNFGFERNQPLTIDFMDQSNTGTTTFKNYGIMVIENVGGKKMKFYNKIRDWGYEDIDFIPFSTTGKSDGYYYEIKVKPNPILELSVYGETEIEDERFRVVLNNLGIQLNEDVEHLFKSSDIQEDGIDYIRLNQKRKEMLLIYPEIYNYIGSYKSLINTINFFGWNDLQLNEYYKNVDVNSPLYQKLQKVEIQDIFDNTIPGYTKNDYVSGKYQTGLVKKTNLFNLTYKITDEDGNNVTVYSLDEVQLKLNKLKRWLKRNILPLSTNIIDITGVADVTSQSYQYYDVSNIAIKSHCTNESTSVNFVYTDTLNFQDNYLFEIEFYTMNGINPSGWTCKIQTFSKETNGNKLIPQKYFKLMKNDLGNFSFNLDKNIDEYLYIETLSYNDFGAGQKVNKMTNTSTSKNYVLVNNNFHIPDYNYLNVDSQYYFFDENGFIYLED